MCDPCLKVKKIQKEREEAFEVKKDQKHRGL